MAYIFFSSHILVVAFQVPLAATQSASVFAAAAPANAGPVTASAMAIAPLASPGGSSHHHTITPARAP